ncbi:hypothetical protein [Polynucleobacter sp. MG-27-Goln-C1]|uniref:hypothetical protein n=1 Tax=Polynucleobacter sp. MG-27-Goln-C1 TaxID=1819726 RepID=UPI001C0AC01E|nr:hypothetical protein [Polynucleobacter sp. MG-27-Goln-C1]MBU3612046.1 hypothetical protein [Polynucleobacter sp. MG-27-Goln-C1]
MEAEYRFVCGSCEYECISGIGVEKGPHFSKAAMVCNRCEEIDTFAVPNPGAMVDLPTGSTVCKTCGSSDQLVVWDGLTCPHCKKRMKAVGTNTKTARPFKYW